jgi:hypothetical protein
LILCFSLWLSKSTIFPTNKAYGFDQLQYSNSIQKFLITHLKNLKHKVQNGIEDEPYFFEGLSTETNTSKDHNNNETNDILDNLDEDNIVLDCPCVPNDRRSITDVCNFIDILQSMIKIKKGDSKIFNELFNIKDNLSNLVSKMYKWIVNKNVESYISLLIYLSEIIEIKLGIKVDRKVAKKKNLWGINKEIPGIDGYLDQKAQNQSTFLQFLLLFTGTKLNDLIK